jgi:hypothetical protein
MLPRAVTEFEGVPPRLLCRVHSNVGRAPSRISLERGVPLEEGGVPIANLIGISQSYCFNFLHPRHREPNSVMRVGFCKSFVSGYCFQNCCKNYLSNCAPMSVCCSLPRYLETSNFAGLPGHLAGYGLPDPCLAVPRCRSLIINPASRNPRLRRLHA